MHNAEHFVFAVLHDLDAETHAAVLSFSGKPQCCAKLTGLSSGKNNQRYITNSCNGNYMQVVFIRLIFGQVSTIKINASQLFKG